MSHGPGSPMRSPPNPARSLAAGSIIVVAVFAVVVGQLEAGYGSAGLPAWLAGVLPNLLAAAAGPLIVFVPFRVVRFWEFVLFAVVVFAGLTAYEFAQKKMPRRTYHPHDIVASGVGAAAAVGFGRVAFFRRS